MELIDRDKLLEKAYFHGKLPDPGNLYPYGKEAVDVDDIESAPTIDAVPVVHGQWERVIPSKSAAKWSTKVSCSICHRQGYTYHKYCPNCGACMDGGK